MELNQRTSGNGPRLTDAVTAWVGAHYRTLVAEYCEVNLCS